MHKHKQPVMAIAGLAQARASARMRAGRRPGFWVATLCTFQAVLGEENVATSVDYIEFCTACHAEGRGFEPRRSRHLQRLTAVIASVPTFQVGFRLLTLIRSRAYDFGRVAARMRLRIVVRVTGT